MSEFTTEQKAALEAALPTDPRDFLTDEDRAEFAAWAEQNRLRRTRIAMDTGLPMNEVA